MSIIEELEQAKSASWVDESGEKLSPTFLPGISEEQIRALEGELHAPFPADYRELLHACSGIEGGMMEVDFTGKSMAFEMLELFPHGLPFATDGCGNFWVADCLPEAEEAVQIFFACHDAPVCLFQCSGIARFLRELVGAHRPNGQSLLLKVAADEVFNVWSANPSTLLPASLQSSPDAALRDFAAELDDTYLVVDLRTVPPGMGFSWGRFGPNTIVRRAGTARIFACGKPPKKKGFLSWFK